jgi:type II secretory pathway component PulM
VNQLLEPALAWWTGREPRERALLFVLGALMLALAAWYGVWAPLNGWAASARDRQAEAAAGLVQAERAQAEIARFDRMRGGKGPATAQALTQSAAQAGVIVSKAEPIAGGGLTVWTNPAEPKALFGWLAGVRRELGVGVRQLEAQKEEGGVQARIAFDGAGA